MYLKIRATHVVVCLLYSMYIYIDGVWTRSRYSLAINQKYNDEHATQTRDTVWGEVSRAKRARVRSCHTTWAIQIWRSERSVLAPKPCTRQSLPPMLEIKPRLMRFVLTLRHSHRKFSIFSIRISWYFNVELVIISCL